MMTGMHNELCNLPHRQQESSPITHNIGYLIAFQITRTEVFCTRYYLRERSEGKT